MANFVSFEGMSDSQKEAIAADLLDPARVQVSCPDHGYVGSEIPPPRTHCAKCWLAYYVYDIATTPPHLRKERVEELSMVVHHMVETEEKGMFDFRPLMRPEWTVEKDVPDSAIALAKESA